MTEKEFFKAWEERVDVFNSPIPNDPYPSLTDRERNIARRIRIATIEALKDMMVGEPIRAVIKHNTWVTMKFTSIYEIGDNEDDDPIAVFDGYHGTDGEEVAVLAVRLS